MRANLHDTPVRRARRSFVPALGLALLASALLAGVAFAQGGTSAPPETTTTTPAPPTTYPPGTALFPLPGAHTFGDGFGVGRGKRRHMGEDILAACGEPLVAVGYTRVVFRGFQRAAGNYLVIRYKRFKQDYMYAHLSAPPLVANKQKLVPGQIVGYVGNTGNASTCHLHFELWAGKWYRGGVAVNPLPSLLAWDAIS